MPGYFGNFQNSWLSGKFPQWLGIWKISQMPVFWEIPQMPQLPFFKFLKCLGFREISQMPNFSDIWYLGNFPNDQVFGKFPNAWVSGKFPKWPGFWKIPNLDIFEFCCNSLSIKVKGGFKVEGIFEGFLTIVKPFKPFEFDFYQH